MAAAIDSAAPFAALLLFASQIILAGLIVGLLLSDLPGPARHSQTRSLRRLAIGLVAIYAPVALIVALDDDAVEVFVLASYGIFVTVGLIAVVVGISLSAFGLCLSDEPLGDGSAAPLRNRQFSLRQLIALVTLVAVICGTVKLSNESTGVLGALAAAISLFAAILLILGGLWLVLVAIPLGVVLITCHPWRNAAISAAAVATISFLVGMLIRFPSSIHVPALFAFAISGHLILVMASLGVLRSCGLRLTRHRTAYELAVRPPDKLVSADQRPS
jgi:hypothetical protein